MIDGRSTYSKVIHLHDILTQDYTLNDSIPYTEIEYKITSTFGYSDKRSYEKFFKLLEQRFFIIKASNAHPIAKRKTVTKQKSNGGDISFQFFRGNPYCWSHYRLGSTPLKPRSPRAPLQSSINEWGVEKEEHMLENICVRVDAEGVTAAPSLDANIRDVSVLSSPEFDVGERNVDRREKRESSIPHTHILSKKLESLEQKCGGRNTAVNMYLQLLKDADTTLTDKAVIHWGGASS